MKLLFNDGDQHIRCDSAPDLRLHGVLAVADETLDAQVLLDPLEEQLDLPSALVQRGNGQCRQSGVVGEEHQRLAGFRVFETDASQLFGIVLGDVETVQPDALVADDPGAAVGWHRVQPVRIHATLGACHEETACLMQRIQAREIQIAAIHDVENARLEGQHVEHIDLVGLAVRDMDESRDVAAQVQQGMQLDRRLGGAKRRPWKQRQAQIDGRCIQRVHRIGQLDTEAVVAVQLARPLDQERGQIGPYMPVAPFVGIGQCRAPDRRTKAHAVQLRLVGQQTGFDVTQALAVSQLRKGHGAELLWTAQAAHAGIATVACHDARQAGPGNEFHDLHEQRLAHVHSSPPEKSTSGRYLNRNIGKLISNRHQNIYAINPAVIAIRGGNG